jgi:DNA replication and repair protein RecF
LSPDVSTTLDVWDGRLAKAGTALADARESLVAQLQPLAADSYAALAISGSGTQGNPRGGETARISYWRSWSGDLLHALELSRREDLRRGTTSVGPHRDDLVVNLAERDARSQASQGEQRCLALALRLAVHRLVTSAGGGPPILLLDDVFSELDPDRAKALVDELPAGQALLTTAGSLPPGMTAATVVEIGAVGSRSDNALPLADAVPTRSAGEQPTP